MAAWKAGLTGKQLREIDEQAARLKAFQSAADSSQAEATLPKLKMEDIPREVETIPTQNKSLASVKRFGA